MRARAIGLVGAATVSATAVGAGAALAAASAQAASAARTPDVTKLFGPALARIHATRRPLFAKAQVYEVDGATARGRSTTSAAGIVRWRFVFDNFASKSKFASATLSYAGGRFGKVNGIKSPFLEDLVIRGAPKMTLSTAVAKLQAAGIRKPFTTVTLRRPVGPTAIPTSYYFGLASGRYVSVNTKTGKVSKLAG